MLERFCRTSLTLTHQLIFAFCLISAGTVLADFSVVDDTGRTVSLEQPAQRIISLAPHTTEMLFSAGAGDRVVGVVSFSDFPEAATKLPQVGGYRQIDLEAILALNPDLIVAWSSGNPKVAIERLRSLGVTVYLTEAKNLEQIATNIERLGVLADTQTVANAKVNEFRGRLSYLQKTFQQRPTVEVFYQVWNEPLMTINGTHLISDLIRLCGGKNVFAELPVIAPTISREAVLAADPEVIVASGMNEQRPEWLDEWRQWSGLKAVRQNNLFFVPPDLLQRQTVRVMDGAEQLCEHLQAARS